MHIGLLVLVVVLIAAGVYLATRSIGAPPASGGERSGGRPGIVDGRAIVTLDVDSADAESAAVKRLVSDAAARVLHSHPDVEVVEVRTRSGAVVGSVSRTGPQPAAPVDLPQYLLEPHTPHHAPDYVAGEATGGVTPHFEANDAERKALAEYFDLPESVRARLRDPDDAVAIVRAILAAAGLQVDQDDDVLVVGDQAIVVVRSRLGEAIRDDALSHAYLRFTASHAQRGVMVTPGILFPTEVRRREMLAPALLHTGPDGIQRMADAVALGADPTRFAAAPGQA